MTFSVLKDPQAVLDYAIDWGTEFLAATSPIDTIATSTWAITGPDSSLTVDADTKTTSLATVWLSGGTLDAEYQVTNRITTAEGRTDDRTITVSVVSK